MLSDIVCQTFTRKRGLKFLFLNYLVCLLQVPKEWENADHQKYTPQEYFAEMSPLFCTTEIPFDHIGEHMQNYTREKELSQVTFIKD